MTVHFELYLNSTHSGLSIAAGAFPLVRDPEGIGVYRSEDAVASGIFCLLDRRPEDPDCEVVGGLVPFAEAFRLRADGVAAVEVLVVLEIVAGAADGSAGAVLGTAEGWAAWPAA